MSLEVHQVVDPPELDLPLTNRQRAVFLEIVRYHEATGEGCSLSYLARRFDLARQTVHQHVVYLRRKGFLRASGSPAVPRHRFLERPRVSLDT
jgi:DNA-binding MarR family transcriptional regulator